MVTDVKDHAVDVLVMEMGVTKRVYMDRCGVTRYSFRRTSGVSYLDMFWDSGVRLSLSLRHREELRQFGGAHSWYYYNITYRL